MLSCFSNQHLTIFRLFKLSPTTSSAFSLSSHFSKVRNFASRCGLPITTSKSKTPAMYKTTSGQTTVTFASFGLYELEDGDNWSYENVDMGPTLTTRLPGREEIQVNASTMPSSPQETPLPPQTLPEVNISFYSTYRSN